MHLSRRIIGLALGCLIISMALARATSAAPLARWFPETGFTVADTPDIRFLSEFTRLGGVETLGYPLSQPFEIGGFIYQAFQRAVLQWRPEVNQAYLANVIDWLSAAGKDAYLTSLGILPPEADAANLVPARAVAERESWLTDEAIARAYREGGGMERYGLPSSRPQQAGPFVVQCFQRYVFQHWLADVPGMPPSGSVVGVLSGELLVQTGLVPQPATIPPPQPASLGLTPSGGEQRVLAIGDSVMLGAATELKRVLGNIEVDAAISRQVANAIEILRAKKAAGQIGPVVVVHVGNNGTFSVGQFDEIMQLLADVPRVVFTNVKVPRSWEGSNNAVLAEGVSRYPNAVLVDWYAASISHPEYFWDDGIHLRPEGARAYADLIASQVP
jgi:hypothetical protein